MSIETTGHKPYKWCPVCDGYGGWDRQTSQPRGKQPTDTNDTYMQCIWCGRSNTLQPVVDKKW